MKNRKAILILISYFFISCSSHKATLLIHKPEADDSEIRAALKVSFFEDLENITEIDRYNVEFTKQETQEIKQILDSLKKDPT